jgi:ketosteroid isomerase-like protein
MDFFAEDASIIPDGQTVTGKVAPTCTFENKAFTLTLLPTHADASTDGSLGCTYGDYQARSGTAISRGIYTTVWRKIGGRWKVALDLGNTAHTQSKPQN